MSIKNITLSFQDEKKSSVDPSESKDDEVRDDLTDSEESDNSLSDSPEHNGHYEAEPQCHHHVYAKSNAVKEQINKNKNGKISNKKGKKRMSR